MLFSTVVIPIWEKTKLQVCLHAVSVLPVKWFQGIKINHFITNKAFSKLLYHYVFIQYMSHNSNACWFFLRTLRTYSGLISLRIQRGYWNKGGRACLPVLPCHCWWFTYSTEEARHSISKGHTACTVQAHYTVYSYSYMYSMGSFTLCDETI